MALTDPHLTNCGSLTLDSRFAPLFFVYYGRVLHAGDYREYLVELDRVASLYDRIAVIHDTRPLLIPLPPLQRREATEIYEELGEKLLEKLAGAAIVVRQPWIRAAATATLLFYRKAPPIEIFRTLDEGFSFSRARLKEHGIDVPDEVLNQVSHDQPYPFT